MPLAIYADKHTTDRLPAEPTVDEQPAGTKPQRQFGRALRELGGDLLAAPSPQATGRVERLVQPFQDRLIKALRLAGIAPVEDANRFVEHSLPVYNRRLAVAPAQSADLHHPTPPIRELEGGLCLQSTRCVRKDCTIVHEGQLAQIRNTVRASHILVEQRLDGTMRLTHHGRALDWHTITARPGSRWQRPSPCPAPTARLGPNRTIRGATGGGRNEHNTRQLPEQNPRHFSCGRKRTFLTWVDIINGRYGQPRLLCVA